MCSEVAMLKKYIDKFNKKSIFFILFLFTAFSILVYLFPLSGDDWAWGAQLGIDRLANGFENYNGRYAGNLLVLILTRSKVLRIIVMGTSFVCACIFPRMLSESKSVLFYMCGAVLFLLMPMETFVQAIVWTSGYSNYVPPILLIMLYFILIKNIFGHDMPRYSKGMPLLTVCIGFVSSLFMENVTLYNIVASVAVIIFCAIRFKRAYFTHILHFVGSILGALLMFSNSAYGFIATGEDTYRTTAFGGYFKLKEMIASHMDTVFELFFENNVIALFIFSLLCVGVCLLYLSNEESKKRKICGVIMTLINIVTLFIIYAKGQFKDWSVAMLSSRPVLVETAFLALISVTYFVSATIVIVICVKDKKTVYKSLFLLGGVAALIAPLMLVEPIGPRCFFPPYLMLITECVVLGVYIKDNLPLSKGAERLICASAMGVCVAMLFFFFNVYYTIHAYDVKRNEYLQKQIDAQTETVKMCKLPYSSWVWNGNPTYAPLDERYKLFYGIDKDVQFEFVEKEGFDIWAENFDGQLAE